MVQYHLAIAALAGSAIARTSPGRFGDARRADSLRQ
jgi:hypothetical protein